jgi:hypothetical protein
MSNISPETEIKLNNFLKELEEKNDAELTLCVKPSLIQEFLIKKGYQKWYDDEMIGGEIELTFSKENENFDENDENSVEEFGLRLIINYMEFSVHLFNE